MIRHKFSVADRWVCFAGGRATQAGGGPAEDLGGAPEARRGGEEAAEARSRGHP